MSSQKISIRERIFCENACVIFSVKISRTLSTQIKTSEIAIICCQQNYAFSCNAIIKHIPNKSHQLYGAQSIQIIRSQTLSSIVSLNIAFTQITRLLKMHADVLFFSLSISSVWETLLDASPRQCTHWSLPFLRLAALFPSSSRARLRQSTLAHAL